VLPFSEPDGGDVVSHLEEAAAELLPLQASLST